MEPLSTLPDHIQARQPPYKFAAALLLTISTTFIILGSTMLSASYEVVSLRERYDDELGCDGATWDKPGKCIVTLDLDDDMDEPVYLYYELPDFFQSNRYYRRSVDWKQISGDDRSKSDVRPYCEPVLTMEDLGRLPSEILESAANLTTNDVANPCGLIAKTLFNDTFTLEGPDGNFIELHFSDLVLDQVGERYDRNANWGEISWTNVDDGSS